MKQLDVYKKMTGEARFLQAIKLSGLTRLIAFSSLENDFPNASKLELVKKYVNRLSVTHGRIRNTSPAYSTL